MTKAFIPTSAAERGRAYRQRQRDAGLKPSRGKPTSSGRKPSLFDAGEFIAVDGEGFSEGPERTFKAADSEVSYTGREHFYALLSASDGSEIYAPDGRLDTQACLDFLLAIKASNKNAILVCFGASYDICQMLAHGLTRDQIQQLMKGVVTRPDEDAGSDAARSRRILDCVLGGAQYRLEYRPRKSLTIWRWPVGQRKYERTKAGKWRMTKCDSVTLWDVWGFFQDSFAGVMRKWIPQDPDYQFVLKMKGERNIFARSEIEEIRRYNAAELRCLVAVMDKLRAAIDALGLTITRWDGAGAIAAAINKLENVKAHKAATPDPVFEAARYAYSGGHIEVCQIGYHDGPVYHYDVSSAYPDQFRRLPSLANGRWIHGTGEPPPGFTVVRIAYDFHPGNPFYPLFFREPNGTILYPSRGCGWYWRPEYEAANEFKQRMGARVFDVLEWWHFHSETDEKPFGWIDRYYARRQQLVDEANRTGIPSGEEKIIKLGLSSLYGKTCQQVGARVEDDEVKPPAYFQLEWAGYVTSGCRAKLMTAALQNPVAVIGFATDGLFATQPLDLDCPTEKILGAWEFKQHDGITMVMPGVYWLHDAGKVQPYSRGFDKAQMVSPAFVHRAWSRKQDHIAVELTRLIGLGSGAQSEMFWAMRGMFVKSRRELALNGDNSKRYPVPLYRSKPHKQLVPTRPRDHLHADLFTPLSELHSAPYSIAWIGDGDEGPDLDAMELGEIADAELAYVSFAAEG